MRFRRHNLRGRHRERGAVLAGGGGGASGLAALSDRLPCEILQLSLRKADLRKKTALPFPAQGRAARRELTRVLNEGCGWGRGEGRGVGGLAETQMAAALSQDGKTFSPLRQRFQLKLKQKFLPDTRNL